MSLSVRAALLTCAALGSAGLVGCGAKPQQTALAIEHAHRRGATVVLTTECAEQVRVTGAADPSDPTLYRVTLWGDPSVGRCHPRLRLWVPTDTTRLLDVTTSQVVNLAVR